MVGCGGCLHEKGVAEGCGSNVGCTGRVWQKGKVVGVVGVVDGCGIRVQYEGAVM